ncbi:9926_t:CDS:2 [Ambispora gerdemannii]|uniref:9926_t:CDS:1 n=1 Tax=Ambispora gerdemannii TaxID=144530 RepID=A0A9N9FVD1_9GLOM|nr:9926_t:CDS:2 [Ambispora gerdemannii]
MESHYPPNRIYKFEFETDTPEDIRVVVGIDFGTTYSSFAYAHVQTCEVIINDDWPGRKGPLKTNTVLQYDADFKEVIAWGSQALVGEPQRRRKKAAPDPPKPIELFKLHFGNAPEEQKTNLPPNCPAEKAITDYLREMEEVERHWPGIDFFSHVRLVFTVPAEFTESTKTIMRQCIYDAGLIKSSGTQHLKFTTEPEAAALYCVKALKEQYMITEVSYLIVDCGGGTVDLTVRILLSDDQIGEATERSGDFCGSTYVDKEFLKYLESKVGEDAMKMLRDKHYGQLHYMIHQFCERVKIPFTGEYSEFKTYELDIEKNCPALKEYVSGQAKEELDEEEWIIELDFSTVKRFFDPIVDQILRLIEVQLDKSIYCSVMFVVGGFSESKYLQKRIKQKFQSCIVIIPPHPMAAIVRGAVEYGLNEDAIKTRVLKWTYGVEVSLNFQPGDPPSRKTLSGRIKKFYLMAKRGLEVEVNQKFSINVFPVKPHQKDAIIKFFYTTKFTASYCDEPEMRLLGEFKVELPDSDSGLAKPILVELCFGSMEIIAEAKNESDGKIYRNTFKLEF